MYHMKFIKEEILKVRKCCKEINAVWKTRAVKRISSNIHSVRSQGLGVGESLKKYFGQLATIKTCKWNWKDPHCLWIFQIPERSHLHQVKKNHLVTGHGASFLHIIPQAFLTIGCFDSQILFLHHATQYRMQQQQHWTPLQSSSNNQSKNITKKGLFGTFSSRRVFSSFGKETNHHATPPPQ